jgi:phosphomannomutase/phosphoglucomutase
VKNLKLFGTSGIRGKSKLEITTKLAKKLGLTFASFLENEGSVIIGRDVRPFALKLSMALISGLVAGGINVEDCGIAPTPGILWALKERKLSGAVVITGSHTPKEMIGFLFFNKDTSELTYEESVRFENLFFNKIKHIPKNYNGSVDKIDISKIYLKNVLKHVNLNKIKSSDYTVVLDPGNGASTFFCSEIFDAAGIKKILVNNQPDGLFPNRDPYPRPEVLQVLSKTVKDSNADFGSASDGDGDRAIFVDNTGKILWGDISGAIFVQKELIYSGGGIVVAPINSSQVINYVCSKYNGKLVFSKIGPPDIVKTMKKENAIIGIEETGKNIWPKTIFYGDWVFSTLKMIEFLIDEKKPLSYVIKDFPTFFMKKEAYPCKDFLKEKVLNQLLIELEKKGNELITLDGIRINYLDGSWILFKPSGTEPVFRVYSESSNLDRVKELSKMGSSLVKKILIDKQ